MKQCKYCRAALPEEALFCPFCEREQVEKLQISAPRPRRRRKLLALLLAFGLLLGGFAFLWRSLHREAVVYNAGSPVVEMLYAAEDGVTYRLFLTFAESPEEAEPLLRFRFSLPDSGSGQAFSLLCAIPEGGTLSDGAAFRELIARVEIRAANLDGSEALEHGEAAYDAALPFAAAAVPLRYGENTWFNELGWILHMKNGDLIYLHHYVLVDTGRKINNAGAPEVDLWYDAANGMRYRLYLATEDFGDPSEYIYLPLPQGDTGQFVSFLFAASQGDDLSGGAAFAELLDEVEVRLGNAPGTSYDSSDLMQSRPLAAAAAVLSYGESPARQELLWKLRMKNGDVIYLHQFVFVGEEKP